MRGAGVALSSRSDQKSTVGANLAEPRRTPWTGAFRSRNIAGM